MLDIWVAQVVKADVGQARSLKQELQMGAGPAGIGRPLRVEGVWKDPLRVGALLPLRQQLCRAGRQGDDPPPLACLGLPHGQEAAFLDVDGAADGQRPFCLVEVGPHEAADFVAA